MKAGLRIIMMVALSAFATPSHAVSLQDLADGERYVDVLQLSLVDLHRQNPEAAGRALRNAARASLLVGDLGSAEFYLRLGEPTPATKTLIAYVQLLRDDPAPWHAQIANAREGRAGYEVIELVDGSAKHDSDSLKRIGELSSQYSGQPVQEHLQRYSAEDRVSPALAASLAVLPGAGYAYLGMWQSAATTLVLTGLSFASAAELYRRDLVYTGTGAVVVGSIFYVGSILNSATSAHDINQRRTKDSRLAIRRSLFPELRFEF